MSDEKTTHDLKQAVLKALITQVEVEDVAAPMLNAAVGFLKLFHNASEITTAEQVSPMLKKYAASAEYKPLGHA